MTCPGRFGNGPYKSFVRCDVCGRIDYERNEGDRCAQDDECPECGSSGGHEPDCSELQQEGYIEHVRALSARLERVEALLESAAIADCTITHQDLEHALRPPPKQKRQRS